MVVVVVWSIPCSRRRREFVQLGEGRLLRQREPMRVRSSDRFLSGAVAGLIRLEFGISPLWRRSLSTEFEIRGDFMGRAEPGKEGG